MILHTNAIGEGVPLVLIHSGGMTGLTEYEEQSDYFSNKNFNVIRPDLRGHGKSGGEIDDYFSSCVEDIKETMEYLNVEKFHIAGVSIGGIVALLFAQTYPDKVKSLCFSGVLPYKPDDWEEMMKEESGHYEQLFNDEKSVSILNEIHGENDWKKLLRSFNNDDFYPFDKTGNVGSLRVPTLCLVGEKQELEVSAAASYKQLNSHINISVIPLAGHLVHRDQPELYSQVLSAFIENTLK